MNYTPLDSADLTTYCTVDEAATLCQVKPGTVRDWLCKRKLTTYKLGSLTLIKRSDLPRKEQEP